MNNITTVASIPDNIKIKYSYNHNSFRLYQNSIYIDTASGQINHLKTNFDTDINNTENAYKRSNIYKEFWHHRNEYLLDIINDQVSISRTRIINPGDLQKGSEFLCFCKLFPPDKDLLNDLPISDICLLVKFQVDSYIQNNNRMLRANARECWITNSYLKNLQLSGMVLQIHLDYLPKILIGLS